MAAQVYRKRRPYRTQFKDLAIGQPYWLASSLATTPRIKINRTGYIGGYTTTTGVPTVTAESDLGVAVIRVPGQFMGQATPP